MDDMKLDLSKEDFLIFYLLFEGYKHCALQEDEMGQRAYGFDL